MLGIIGKKIGMTRVIQDDGRVIPVTVVLCEPNTIAQVKTAEKDGYPALVLGFSALKKARKTKKFRCLKEFKLTEAGEFQKDGAITVESFQEGDLVSITGTSKGKGTQGTIKRHNFHGGPASHGSHFHREPGSIGARAKPGRVNKGHRMAGRMGNETVTRKRVPVVYVDGKNNLIAVKGAIAGSKGQIVIIKSEKA